MTTELRRALQSVSPPDETGAERRAWALVRTAFAEREPVVRERSFVRPVIALVLVGAVVAAAVSPPGLAVLGRIRKAIAPTRIERSAPALFALPAPGRLLVESSAGVWAVDRDGSKRLLGPYREAAWSPFGRFVAATRGHELVALTPGGRVRWSITRPGLVSAPQWTGSRIDTRIAYREGSSLRIVGGDSRGDHVLARHVAAFAWLPSRRQRVVAYLQHGGQLVVRDADTGRVVWRRRVAGGRLLAWSPPRGQRLVVVGRTFVDAFARGGRHISSLALPRVSAAAFSPSGTRLAILRQLADGRSEAVVVDPDLLGQTQVLVGLGAFDGLAWSPDGRWLLVGWRSANQWVFEGVKGGRKPKAVSDVRAQFASGGHGSGFPAVAAGGWCCAS
jgi:hypothetical protein